MDKDAISALEGRELDAKVAEVVFGWRWIASEVYGKQGAFRFIWPPNVGLNLTAAKGDEPLAEEWATYQGLPAYSSTWESMGLVVEGMKAHGWGYYVLNFDGRDGSNEHVAVFSNADGTRNVDAKGETAPLAVARAALLALQEEE